MSAPVRMMKLALDAIRVDGGTQARLAINEDVVADYSACLADGAAFPPVVVFHDGADYWLADGHHRYHAHRAAGRSSIDAQVRSGSQRDAVLYAVGSNADHGLRRTHDDKRKAVGMLLADAEWLGRTDSAIAKQCAVSHTFVAKQRASIATLQVTDAPVLPRVYITKHGTQAVMRTANIGKAKRLESDSTPAAKRVESDSTPPANPQSVTPRPVISAAGAAVVAEPAKDTPPAGPTEAEQIAAEAHGDTDIVTLLEETQRELEAAQRQIQAMQADDQRAETLKWQRAADVAARRQEEIQARLVERENELTRLMKTLRRIGQSVGEDDPRRIAAAVEDRLRHEVAG
jgi:uncharacterized ParB-like nuclease family protein